MIGENVGRNRWSRKGSRRDHKMLPTTGRVLRCLTFCPLLIAASASMEDCLMHCNGFDGRDLCVTADLTCDNFPDCANSEDEAVSICGCEGFICSSNGFCLDASERCNGYSNCFDHSDEINCTKSDYKQTFPELPEHNLCKKRCGHHGSCSFKSDDKAVCVCDEGYSGVFCENVLNPETATVPTQTSEEEESTGSSFSCDRKEIPMKLFCNGEFDCADKTDEMNCTLEDYRSAKPHVANRVANRFLCLMPCKRINCAFDISQKAYCPCPENSEGVFCESLTEKTLFVPTASAELNEKLVEEAIAPEQSSTRSRDLFQSFLLATALACLICATVICYRVCSNSKSGRIRISSVSGTTLKVERFDTEVSTL